MSNLVIALVFAWSVGAVAIVSYVIGRKHSTQVSKKEMLVIKPKAKQCGREKCKSKNCE